MRWGLACVFVTLTPALSQRERETCEPISGSLSLRERVRVRGDRVTMPLFERVLRQAPQWHPEVPS